MSDRKDAYYLQLVGEAFFDECFDDLEAADRLLAVDMTFIGIVSGVVTSEHAAPPDLTVDVTAGVSYDQAGRRCHIPSGVSGHNCAVDENGTSTAVGAAPNERWLSLQLRFDRTLTDAQVDGNGTTVYVDQDESYELAVVMAGEFPLGTNTKPALPADGRLVCDIKLIFGQTQILNADIFTDRRQDFSIFSAAEIPVTSGAWGFLNPATDDVQAVFDFIDDYSLVTNAATELLQNVIPSAAGQNLGEAAKEWDLYVLELVTVAASRVDGHLLPKNDGNDLGSAALKWSLYSDFIDLNGNLDLDGEIITSAGSRINGNLIPKAGTEDLGSAALRWDAFLNTLTVYTGITAAAGGEAIGGAGTQFAAHLTALTHYGALAGTHLFSAAKSVTVLVTPDQAMTTTWNWNPINGWHTAGSPEVLYWYIKPPHGAVLQSARIRWYQVTNKTLVAQITSVDEDNTEANIGAAKTISANGVNTWDTIAGALAETIDNTTKQYRVKIGTGTAEENRALMLELTYDVTDILKAALTRG